MARLPRSLGDIVARLARPVRTGWPVALTGVLVEKPRWARVELGGVPAVQTDESSCGSACLVMLAATGDEVLAEWLETGVLPKGLQIDELPPEIPANALVDTPGAAGRFAAAQRAVKESTSFRAVGPLPWPRRLGTLPWAAARVARFPGVRYVHRPVDDRGDSGREMLSLVLNALGHGYPVLLYSGGTRSSGWTTALPRHVLLAVPAGERRVTPEGTPIISIYEPHSGRVFEVPANELADRTEPSPALGHWSNIQWLVLPVPATSTRFPEETT
ncbi:MAG TPA: hypothetical protein VFC82_07975 [Actinomycetaceae bacterium]|nr:hypothetical protein [Actinomycetaceae bacterium]